MSKVIAPVILISLHFTYALRVATMTAKESLADGEHQAR